MKIELFYFRNCPSYKQTIRDLGKILKEKKINVKVEMVEIKSEQEAKKVKFIGSPTLRINGKDIDSLAGLSKHYGMRCRIYFYKGKISPSPPEEMIVKSLEEVV